MDAEFAFDLSHTEQIMHVITRQKGESLVIGDDIIITVVEIRGDEVRLGVEAPKEIPAHNRESIDAVRRADSVSE